MKKRELWACGSLDCESTGITKRKHVNRCSQADEYDSLTERHRQILVPL